MASLKVLCSIGLQGAFVSLTPELEKLTGTACLVSYGVATAFKEQIEKGIAFDVAILTRSIIDSLSVQGRLAKQSVVDIAQSGLGLAVPLGAPKPDISSVEALTRTLLSAESIASSANGLAGLYFMDVMKALGIVDQVRPKLKLETSGGYAAEIAARGDAEMAVQLISEILPVAGVQLVGSFPAEVQKYAVLSAAVSSESKQGSAAEGIIRFLADPLADETLKARGLDRCG